MEMVTLDLNEWLILGRLVGWIDSWMNERTFVEWIILIWMRINGQTDEQKHIKIIIIMKMMMRIK